jgi:hypothetical protein
MPIRKWRSVHGLLLLQPPQLAVEAAAASTSQRLLHCIRLLSNAARFLSS